MTVSSVEATPTGMFGAPISGATDASTTGTTTKKTSDKDTFLQLLVAQLRYQDPSNPTDSSQFLAQSAQFTSLEKMQAVADQTQQLLTASMSFGASGLVGRNVSWTDATGATGTGTVSGVSFGNQGPVLTVGSSSVPMSEVTSVVAGTTTSTATGSTTSGTTTTV
jgi:flagellar basal-body rod modification protein FlgD